MKTLTHFRAFAGLLLVGALLSLAQPSRAILTLIKKGTSGAPIMFALYDNTTGQTAITGQTGAAVGTAVNLTGGVGGNITVTIHQAGLSGTSAATGQVEEIGVGLYYYLTASGDTSSATSGDNIVAINVTCSGCQSYAASAQVVSFDPNNATTLGLGALPNAAPAANGGLPTSNANNQVAGIAPGGITILSHDASTRSVLFRAYLTITGGTASPATTDNYATSGLYNNGTSTVAYYQSNTLGTTVYAWTDGTYWYLTTTSPGTVPSSGTSYFKTASSATVSGPYSLVPNGGTGSGTPTVTPHGNAVLASFQPETLNLSGSVGSVGSVTSNVTVGAIASGTTAPSGFFGNASAPASAWWANFAQPSWAFFSSAPGGWMANDTTTLNAISSNLLASTVEGLGSPTISVRDALLITSSLPTNIYTVTRSTSAPWTITTVFYRGDGTTKLSQQISTYTDATFAHVVSRAAPTYYGLP